MEISGNRTSWLDTRSEDDCLSILREVSRFFANRGDCSRLLDFYVQEGRYRELVDFEVPRDLEVNDFCGARQIQALFNKQDWVDLGYNPLEEGVKAFLAAELRCKEVNDRFDLDVRPSGRAAVASAIAREKLRQLFGPVPSLAQLMPRFGPGANTRCKRVQASLVGKLRAHLACSEDMFPRVDQFLSETPHLVREHCIRSRSHFPIYTGDPDVSREKVVVSVDLGDLCFVPKNAKTHRPIVVEPPLNGFWQLGVGTYLKGRLASFGIDLTDQSRNRKLACKGSVDGSLATVDLKSASDTNSWGCVSDLVPPEWVEFLGTLRTGSIFYDGLAFRLEKFSSMGNGYTFELESAIFWSLCFGCVKTVGGDVRDIGVYGDDLIVPTDAYELLEEVLDFYGFWVNTQKSFVSGPFRESCGADWLRGHDVRPFFVREKFSDRTLFMFHNWAIRNGEPALARYLLSRTYDHNRLYGPDGYGDGHLLGDYSLYTKRKYRRRGWEGGWFDTYSFAANRTEMRSRRANSLLPTYSVYRRTGAENPTDPAIAPGSSEYVRTPIYTLREGIFLP